MSAKKSRGNIYEAHAGSGRLLYRLLAPIIRLVIRRSRRAYVLIYSEDRVLLIQNWLSPQGWRLPGGGVHRGETAISAAVRELKEELGVTVDASNLKALTRGVWHSDNLGYRYMIFLAKLSKTPSVKKRRGEIVEYIWLRPSALNAKNVIPEIANALKAARL